MENTFRRNICHIAVKTVDGKPAERSDHGSDNSVIKNFAKSSYASLAETVVNTTSRSPHGEPG